MFNCLSDDDTLLAEIGLGWIGESSEVRLTTRQHEEVWTDDLESSNKLISDPQYFICLICLYHYLGEFLHGLTGNWLWEGNHEVVVQITLAILRYLFEVGRGGLDQVDYRDVRDPLSDRINVLVQQDVAAAKRANVHDWSDNVLTIRVKNEGLESE